MIFHFLNAPPKNFKIIHMKTKFYKYQIMLNQFSPNPICSKPKFISLNDKLSHFNHHKQISFNIPQSRIFGILWKYSSYFSPLALCIWGSFVFTRKKSKNLFQKINLLKFYSYLHKHRSNGTYFFWKLIKTMYLSQPPHFQYFRSLLSTVNKLYFFALNILWVLCFQYGNNWRWWKG